LRANPLTKVLRKIFTSNHGIVRISPNKHNWLAAYQEVVEMLCSLSSLKNLSGPGRMQLNN